MENLSSPFSADTPTITDDASQQNKGFSLNSQLSTIQKPLINFSATSSNPHGPENHNMMRCPPSSGCTLCPFCFCPNQRSSWLLQSNQDRRIADAYKSKVARSKRKLARQRSLTRTHPPPPPPPPPCPNSSKIDSMKLNTSNGEGSNNRDLYTFLTPDNKKLRVLLTKELKHSDVGGLGRIVLPKRETEENLPTLSDSDKEGVQIVIKDVYSTRKWSLKFKFWCNNKSRMYVLENAGDFVRQNRLEIGDSLILYEDESKNLGNYQYFSVKKVEKEEVKYTAVPIGDEGREEEEALLALLIEQLKHKEQQDNSLVTLSMDIAVPPNSHKLEEVRNAQIIFNNDNCNNIPASASSTGHHNMIDDCYTGLEFLPEVNWYNFSL